MLHTIAAGTSDSELQQTAFIVQARQAGFQFEPGAAVAARRDEQAVEVGATTVEGDEVLLRRSVRYDTLIGSVHDC